MIHPQAKRVKDVLRSRGRYLGKIPVRTIVNRRRGEYGEAVSGLFDPRNLDLEALAVEAGGTVFVCRGDLVFLTSLRPKEGESRVRDVMTRGGVDHLCKVPY